MTILTKPSSEKKNSEKIPLPLGIGPQDEVAMLQHGTLLGVSLKIQIFGVVSLFFLIRCGYVVHSIAVLNVMSVNPLSFAPALLLCYLVTFHMYVYACGLTSCFYPCFLPFVLLAFCLSVICIY